MDRRRIFSADLTSITTKLDSSRDEYLLNPIHRLYVPTAAKKPLANLPSTLALAGPDSVVALQRFSRPEGEGIQSTALVAEQLIDRGHLLLTAEQLLHLTDGIEKQGVSSLEEIQQFENDNLENYLTLSFTHVEKGTETVLIESFNDSAWIWEGLDRVDLVLVVGPGQVFSYNPERFRKAAFLQKRPSMPIREVTFSRINDLLKPLTRDAWTPAGLETVNMLSEAFDRGPSKKS
jgi:predicted P-loop ATPase/GTPase